MVLLLSVDYQLCTCYLIGMISSSFFVSISFADSVSLVKSPWFFSQGHKEWLTEVNFLGIVEHQNLVKLVGYCAEDDERWIQRLLVYEYMVNRSVQDHLSQFKAPLPWITRLKIAQDAARGLAYLHEGMEFQVPFCPSRGYCFHLIQTHSSSYQCYQKTGIKVIH